MTCLRDEKCEIVTVRRSFFFLVTASTENKNMLAVDMILLHKIP